jgi:hypothetical protein
MNDYNIKKIYEEMELHLIRSMKRNLGKHLTDEIAEGKEWKMWQAEKLKELKRYQRQNKDIIKAYTSGLDKDIADILKEEFKQGHKSEIKKYKKLFDKKVSDSFFKLNDRKANALIKVVNDDLNKANIAALRMMNDTYRQTIHKAATFASNGVMTQKQAVDMATKDFLSRGLNVVEYSNGARVNIASYSQMAVRTASQRAMLMGEGEFRKSIGETLVIISKHGTACKLCQPHESQVYIDDVYSGGKPDGKHKLLSDAMEQGLFHPNCRHGISTYYGLDDEDEEETTANVPKENNNEKESYIDRQIQKEKRKVTGFQSPDNLKTAQQRLKELEAQKLDITNYTKFPDGSTVRKFFNDSNNSNLEDWMKGLTSFEKNSILSYSQGDYYEINETLRKINEFTKENAGEYYYKINQIEKAIDKFELKQDILVYRKVNYNAVRHYDLTQLVGKDVIDKGFMSTSTLKEGFNASNDVIMEIAVPKGSKGAFINDLSGYQDQEYEFLLQRNTKLKIHEVLKQGDKIFIKAVVNNE